MNFGPSTTFRRFLAAIAIVSSLLGGCADQGGIFVNTNPRVHPLPPLTGDPLETSDVVQIADLTGRMRTSIFQRDVIAFLGCCTPTDSATRTEHRYFANDFLSKPVSRIDIRVIDLVARSGRVAEGTLSWRWAYKVDGKEVSREHFGYARFINTSDGWLYDGPLWERLVERDAQVWYLRGYEPAARAAMSAFRTVKSSVEATLRAHPTGPHIIKLYRSPQELKFSISLSYNDDIDGWNEPGESIRLVTAKDKPESEFRSLIAHEYGHVCTFALGPTANDMPWWTLEGMAELAAEPFTKDGIEHVRSLREESAKGTLVPLADLASMDTIRPENFGKVYSQGRGVVRHVLTTYGPAKLDAWLRAMANGMSYSTACSSILGVTATELERRWRDSMQ